MVSDGVGEAAADGDDETTEVLLDETLAVEAAVRDVVAPGELVVDAVPAAVKMVLGDAAPEPDGEAAGEAVVLETAVKD